MKRSHLISLAAVLDGMAGDPEWLPHPVRTMGRCIGYGEELLYNEQRGSSYQLFAGGMLTFVLAAGTYAAAHLLLRGARRVDERLGAAVELLLASSCLASRNLHDEALSVLQALEQQQLDEARIRIARIVGRDTADLNDSEISRALIETLAESASDGVMAPLFYLATGGIPLALCYKAINTMDSMIGHADERYFWFGKVAARLDDVANFVPSRITAALITALSPAPSRALKLWMRDGSKHKSPNAGQPESALSGSLAVQLGGSNRYDGVVVDSPVMGQEFPSATPADARRALRITVAVSIAGALVATALSAAFAIRPTRRVKR